MTSNLSALHCRSEIDTLTLPTTFNYGIFQVINENKFFRLLSRRFWIYQNITKVYLGCKIEKNWEKK